MRILTHYKIILFIFLATLFFEIPVSTVSAFDSQASNNKFGIHLAQPQYEDIEKAAELVNSNGGKWGYITLVIQENDRDQGKWQDIFNKLREYKLIPIIRLATKPEGEAWRRPEPQDADSWVSFLNALNWVVKDRYIILFNEPNHALEWGGKVDSKHYAQVAKVFAESFKKTEEPYVIMPAGFDASAPAALPNYEDEARFIEQMIDEIGVDEFNRLFDAWSSHSYPNPGFSGAPTDRGRETVSNYRWELQFLKQRGIKDLPVFITETGWDGNQISRERIADYYESAFSYVWLHDDMVRAVTPFVLNYQADPFAKFSFARLGNEEFHPQYYRLKDMTKVSGEPEIQEKGHVRAILPLELVVFSNYHFKIDIKNIGQSIWDVRDGYHLVLEGADPQHYFFSDIRQVKPGEQLLADLYVKTGEEAENKDTRITLYKGDKKVLEGSRWRYEIVASPSLILRTRLYPKFKSDAEDYELQLFDENEELVYKKKGIGFKNGLGELKEVQNVALGSKYRAVLLKPYYLPRQTVFELKKDVNKITFEGMIPADFDRDGNFDIYDIGEIINKPALLKLLLP